MTTESTNSLFALESKKCAQREKILNRDRKS